MFKGHPKGLFVAFFTNMGERFGFYTMVAIFILFLQAKYNYNAATSSQIYGTFLFGVYFLPLLGGFIADKFLGYGKTISIGLIIMFLGYLILAFPTERGTGIGLIFISLGVIALGTGMFKGNLQALVGNLYDNPEYSQKRDKAFSLFYMGINVGAMFAPTAAELMSNWILSTFHFTYDNRIPALANQFLVGNTQNANSLLTIAQTQDASITLGSLGTFAESYLNALSKSYHFSFGIACISLIISMLIFWGFKKYYKSADITEHQKSKDKDLKNTIVEMPAAQVKQRLIALGLVFFVVIFFWMSFHQNAVTMTYFARDYTQPSVSKITNLWFDLTGLLAIFASVSGLVFLVRNGISSKAGIIGGVVFVVAAVLAYFRFMSYGDVNPFGPQKFQHFNPFFIVALTPLVVGLFSYLERKGKEPSAPRKIGFGMLITSVGFTILIIGSIGLTSPKELGGMVAPADMLVSPYWLISTYFILTVAELFLSPMGISFVSRVAPPKYKGLMQGGWFAATAIGNYLLSAIGYLWGIIPLWMLWLVLVTCCLLSAIFIFSVMKRLELATKK